MTEQEIKEAIFGEIEKMKEHQIKLHAIFKGEKNETTKIKTQPNHQNN